MSTPDRQARLDVTSPTESLQISLIDSTFAQIASGSGALRIDDVRPGIYELRLSASTATDTRLIRLRPGDVFRETVDLSFPTAVPLPQSTTWNEAHQIAATRASEHVVRQASSQRGAGGLLVMARATQSSDEPLAVPQFELTRESEPIRVAKENWWRGSGRDWIVQAATVEPGGYGLRTWGEDGTAVEQSLWVSEGWQTLAFVPFGLLGLAPSRASVVMLSIRQPWRPELAEPTWQAAELAIAGLRERRTVLPHDVLDLLVREKFIDPMLGVLAAHALLLEPRIDFETLDVVVNNLATLLAGAPDVAALVALGEEARAPADWPQREPSPLQRLDWPPMLLVAYTALIRLDARREGAVIAPGSPAQTVAGRLSGDSVWTSWTVQAHPPSQRRKRRGGLRLHGPDMGESLLDVETDESATQRVADYLALLADTESPRSLDALLAGDLGRPARISAATSVPLRSVHEALGTIKDNLE